MWGLLLLAAAVAAAPAKGPVERQKKQVVDAIRNCPVAGPGEIAVCARDRGIAEGYRIPRLDPRFARKDGGLLAGGVQAVSPGVAGAGTGSCSNSGGGGFTGCGLEEYRTWGQLKAQARTQGQGFPW